MSEIWHNIMDSDYQVSTLGRVRNYKGDILKHEIMKKGYHRVHLHRGVHRKILVHRLVASAFIPNPHNKPQVNHKDADKSNNGVDNLEWATNRENMDHKVANNLSYRPYGELANSVKLNNDSVHFIRSSNLKTKELAEKFSVHVCTIQRIKNGITWNFGK